MTEVKGYVTYEDFGAKGDGITDDMPSIVACHEYANLHGLEVRGDDGANYYIGGKNITAVIKTNVNWGKAKFTIDDREIENRGQNCFWISSDSKTFTPNILSLKKGQKKVDLGIGGSYFVSVFDDTRRVYIRKGLNMDNGRAASDCFVVCEDGTVVGDINWNYERITSAVAISTDDKPIVIEGGIFTTIANCAPSFYNYHSRNIRINRSHVTVKDITYYVTGEGDHGAPYSGFLSIDNCYDVVLKDCLLTPHFTYRTESKIPGEYVSMGTYSINISAAVDIKLLNINQTIDITDNRYWGLMGTNFSKKFYMENCEISRYDAHMGVTDCVIKNCKLGYMGTNLIGFGECVIENTTFCSSRTVSLRSDYGSTFCGKLIMRNCRWIPLGAKDGRVFEAIQARNSGTHDFGYTCYMPREIVIDGLLIEDEHINAEDLSYCILPEYDSAYEEGRPYEYQTAEKVTVRGVYAKSGRRVVLCRNEKLYPHITDYDMQ